MDYLNAFEGVVVDAGASGTRPARSYTIEEIIPAGLCPLFYHNLMPYMATLLDGGWFRWVRRDKNSFLRRRSFEGAFKDGRVNSAFPNEVLVQCPNHMITVVAGVGVKRHDGKKRITLRILRSDGICPAGYIEGTEIEVAEDDITLGLDVFNALSPAILNVAQKGSGSIVCRGPLDGAVYTIRGLKAVGDSREVCSKQADSNVKAETLRGECRYHASSKPVENIHAGPPGFCQDAHHAAYPYALELIYNDAPPWLNADGVTVHCPGVTNKVVFRVQREWTAPLWLRRLKGAAAKVFGALAHPVDIIDCRVTYTVARVDGRCPAGHKTADTYEFNMDKRTELCPASFHALYPYLFLKRSGIPFYWTGRDIEKDEPQAANMTPCPDCMGAIYKY